MKIKDNGVLKTSQTINEGFGLKTMKDRLEEIGGHLYYSNVDPQVFEIIAEIPENYRPAYHNPEKGD